MKFTIPEDSAVSAASAGNAVNAVSAGSAVSAGNAGNEQGLSPSTFQQDKPWLAWRFLRLTIVRVNELVRTL